MASDAVGNFVIVWSGEGPHDGDGVFARLFDASGTPVGDQFAVNTFTAGEQDDVSVAMSDSGAFVVVWESDDQDGDQEGIFARRFSAVAVPLDVVEFQVSEIASDQQLDPCVAMDGAGNFVVVWEAFPNFDGSAGAVFQRRFGADGVALAGDVLVNTETFDGQRDPWVSMADDGRFVVVWESASQDFGATWGVFSKVYDAAGTPLTSDIPVNTYVELDQRDPAVYMNADGAFVVGWSSDGQDGSGFGVYARGFDATGTATTGEIQVNLNTIGWQGNPGVGMDAQGHFTVVFEDQDGDRDVRCQDFRNDGTAMGDQPVVNLYTDFNQDDPQLAVSSEGRTVVVWETYGQDGSEDGIFARRRLIGGIFADGFEDGTTAAWN